MGREPLEVWISEQEEGKKDGAVCVVWSFPLCTARSQLTAVSNSGCFRCWQLISEPVHFRGVWRYFPWWSLKYPLNSSPRMSVASQWEIPLCLFMLINLPNPLTCIAGASSNSDAESDSKALLTLVSSDCDLFSVDLEIMHLHTQHQETLPYVFQVHKHTIIN